MSEREKFHTPRSLAAILNPDSSRGGADAETAQSLAAGTGVARPDGEWHTLRDRVFRGQGKIELLLFRAGEETFALPIDSVIEALDEASFHVLPDMPAHVAGMINMDGRSIPVYNGQDFLGVATTGDRPSVLIVRGSPDDAGLVVDTLMSSALVETAEIRRVPGLEDADGILVGVFFHSDELVALLDPAGFVRMKSRAEAKNES
jgi:purine-binding chemotaxis protein CheW